MDSNSKNPTPSHSNSNNPQKSGIDDVSICQGVEITPKHQDEITKYIKIKYPSLEEIYIDNVIKLLSQKDPAATHENAASIEECVTGFIAYTKLKEELENVATLQGINRPTSGSVDFIVTFTLTEKIKNEFFEKILADCDKDKIYYDKDNITSYLNNKFEFGIDPFGSIGSVHDKNYIETLKKHTNNTKNEGTEGLQTVGVAHTNENINVSICEDFYKMITNMCEENDNFNLVVISGIDSIKNSPKIIWKNNIIENTVLNKNRMASEIGGESKFGNLFE